MIPDEKESHHGLGYTTKIMQNVLNPLCNWKPVFGDEITWIYYTEGFGGSNGEYPTRSWLKKPRHPKTISPKKGTP